MQQITKQEFETILKSAEAENAERLDVGLQALEVTTKDYDGSLIEYYFGGMLFGFIQEDNYYSNGI